MNAFVKAVETIQVEDVTDNGMKTYASSLSANVDLFFRIGSARNADITNLLANALGENLDLAVRNVLWSRDPRGGAGERTTPQKLMLWMVTHGYVDEVKRMLPLLPELGRWDDLFIFRNTNVETDAFNIIANGLLSGNGLCAKWCPREKNSNPENKAFALALAKHMKLSGKAYRKLLVGLTNVVETKMCAKQWNEIEFNKLPSVASARYQKAFTKNAPTEYAAYKSSLSKGETTVNASVLFPHDVIRSLNNDYRGENYDVINAQWEALPNYVGDRRILPMCDVSGSMTCTASGSISCLDISIALGLYLASKNTGAYHGATLTFSRVPRIDILKGKLTEMKNQLNSQKWNMSTNIVAAFDAILNYAIKGNVPDNEMPEYLLILSDMEFDECIEGASALESVRSKFSLAGYTCPKIVFWNLNVNRAGGNVPVKFDESGTALISGFSPSIMTSVLSGEDLTPESIMLAAINKPRYNW